MTIQTAAMSAAMNSANSDHIINFGLRTASASLRTASGSPGTGEQTVSGNVSSSKNGDGTFSKMMEEVNGQKTVDKTVTFANGKTKETERTVTVNADGSKTISKTNANGKTSTIQESKIKNDDGSVTISKDITRANGHTVQSTDTMTKSMDGTINNAISRTNAKGETETLDRTTTDANGVRTVTTTGTGYNGNTINNETTWTTLA